MQFSKKTVLGLFDSSQRHYEIPVYQRAYSWEKDEWQTFLNDLLEQIEGENNYFYGNILLETIEPDVRYEVIDGQQRLTTLSIFIRSIINTLNERKQEKELEDFSFDSKLRIYIKNEGNIKLRPVEYDRVYYDALIVEDRQDSNANTPSQKRIEEAKRYFINELQKLETKQILKILSKVEKTELTTIELQGKKDSALMFELENNRGKDLTNMEKIKSYFMYQMYVYSDSDHAETNIEGIANIFKAIYQIINDLKIDEDSVLYYHNNAYINGFNYRTLEDVKAKFKKADCKIAWIKDYINELYESFSNIKKFEKATLSTKYAKKLNGIGVPAYVYPFIIKGYKYLGDNNKKLNTLFKILEVVVFRARLINSRANIYERLNPILNSFENDVIELKNLIKDKLNDEWYWGDTNTKTYLNGHMYGNKILNYLLWEYEDYLQNKGYHIGNISIKDEEIEHISPVTPTSYAIFSGYQLNENGVYSEDFIDEHLNSLGNLMLTSKSHNASMGNKPFKDKLQSYQKNPLLNQQAEIKKYVTFDDEGAPYWKYDSIHNRHKSILDFAIKRWSFDNIML